MANEVIMHVQLTPLLFTGDDDFAVWPAALRGAYCSIIFFLYNNDGRTKNDLDRLRILAGWRGDGWEEAWFELRKKFQVRGKYVTHKKVKSALAEARRRMEAKHNAGVAGAQGRWQTHSNRNGSAIEGKVSKGKVSKQQQPPLPPKGATVYSDSFLAFWTAYPKKVGKGAAWKAWKRIDDRPGTEDLVRAIEAQAATAQWQKNRGQFIPHPATWLNQRRWEDEVVNEAAAIRDRIDAAVGEDP